MERKSHLNPWLSIWFRPRKTINEVIQRDPNYRIGMLSALYGFPVILNFFKALALNQKFEGILMLILAIVISPIWGYISFSISSWFLFFTGKWIDGKSDYSKIRAALAWSSLPYSFVFSITMFILFFVNFDGHALMNILLVLRTVTLVWVIVLTVSALSEVQKFSVIKSVFNLILGFVTSVIAVVVLFVLFTWIQGWIIGV